MNRIILVGNLCADAEFKQHGERGLIKFRLAATEKWGSAENQKHTEFANVCKWGATEKLAQAMPRGQAVAVVGSMRTRSYEKDGQKRWMTEIHADSIELLGGGGQGKPKQTDTEDSPF